MEGPRTEPRMADQDQAHDYALSGGITELWQRHDPDVLVEGAAGTGKSFGWGVYIDWLCRSYRGCRVLVVRKTRASLTEAWMQTFETKVLWVGHPAIGLPRKNRTSYEYPNGSRIILGGMGNADQKTRLFSTEYDLVYVQEATELSEDEWESLHRALRNGIVPWQQLGGDCNPDAEHHWLNQRCNKGLTRRLLTKHADNPTITDEYLKRLSNLTGVRRDRLYLGLWVTAEGAIWPNYDANVHLIEDVPKNKHGDSIVDWYFAGIDWGYRNPGAMQLWGVDKQRRAYLVREIYRREQNTEWWAERAARWHKTYGLRCIVADPADPDSIDLFNKRIRSAGGKGICIPANNAVKAGLDIVRERLDVDRLGQSRVYFLRQRLETGRCPLTQDKNQPCSVTEEIPSYCYAEMRDGRPIKEEPAPDSYDHGSDALRYSMVWLDWATYRPKAKRGRMFEPGTLGHILDHETTLREIKAGKWNW